MAIAFMHAGVVSAGWTDPAKAKRPPESAVAASAYQNGCRIKNAVTLVTSDFRRPAGGILHRAILLPAGASPRFLKRGYLWSEVERRELVRVRKAGEVRFREGAVFARRYKIALPKEFTLEQNIRLIEDFADKTWVVHGVAVDIAIHPPDDPTTGNIHAHVLVTHRLVSGSEIGEIAAQLEPAFASNEEGKGFVTESSQWPQRWAAAQEAFALAEGIPLEVDPISLVPRKHIGPSGKKATERIAANKAAAREEQAILKDPARLLERISERYAIFSLRDVLRILAKAGINGMDARRIAWATLKQKDVVALEPPVLAGSASPRRPAESLEKGKKRTGERRFTTRSILHQEYQILDDVEHLYMDLQHSHPLPAGTAVTLERLIKERGLDEEQAAAARHLLRGPGIAVLQGRAGAGKSYLLKCVADTLEDAGYHVVGLAPTNAVVGLMRKDGYKDARTLHRFLNEVRRGKRKVGPDTAIIVDEGAMVDTAIYGQLLRVARRQKCRVMLVGDDRQLAPVGRGGIYTAIRKKVGCAELKKIRRQRHGWMLEASLDLSEYNIGRAIKAYSDQNGLVWGTTIATSAGALVKQWAADYKADPSQSTFVYAGTNEWVNKLNRALQKSRWQGVTADPPVEFECCRGTVEVRVGDRIQFHANDPKLNLYNGTLATITGIGPAGIEVHCDDGTESRFDPTIFADWGLGYAGSIHRGQGKTQDRVYALYDHSFVWNAAATYVALTRHRDSVKLYVPRELAVNEGALIDQMSRTSDQQLASDLVPARKDVADADLSSALYPLQQPIEFEYGPARSRKKGDLNLEGARLAAERHFKAAPVEDFVADYRRLDTVAKDAEAANGVDNQAEMLRKKVTGFAWLRGFKPGSGAVDETCLHHQLLPQEMDDHHIDAQFSEKGHVDFQPIAFEPSSVNYRPMFRMAWRMRQLDAFVLDEILARIGDVRFDLIYDEAKSAVLGFAGYLVKVSRALAYGLPVDAGRAGWRSIRAEEGTPRLVWKPLRIEREGDTDWPAHLLKMNGRAIKRLEEITRSRLDGSSDAPMLEIWKPELEVERTTHRWWHARSGRPKQDPPGSVSPPPTRRPPAL